MEFVQRKINRIPEFDYGVNGAYFVTICTQNRRKILSQIVGDGFPVPKTIGLLAEEYIKQIPQKYSGVYVDKYVIMPDHIHLLLRIRCDENGLAISGPKINRVIQQVKGVITKEIGFSIWQKSYNDHIVRDLEDYKNIWEYIENNPLK